MRKPRGSVSILQLRLPFPLITAEERLRILDQAQGIARSLAHKLTSAYAWGKWAAIQAEDLMQEALLGLIEVLDAYDPLKGPAAPFVRVVLERRMIDYFRGKETKFLSRQLTIPAESDDERDPWDRPVDAYQPHQLWEQEACCEEKETAGFWRTLFQQLAPKEQRILEACFLQEREQQELAHEFQVSEPTITKWKKKAFQKIKQILAVDYPPWPPAMRRRFDDGAGRTSPSFLFYA